MTPEESQFIGSFVKPSLQRRWLEMLKLPKKRQEHLKRLFHGFDFNASIIETYKGHAAKQEDFISLLLQRGAGGPVHVISANPMLDGKIFTFQETTAHQRNNEGCAWDAASICIYHPKHIAVFADEYDRHILFNPR